MENDISYALEKGTILKSSKREYRIEEVLGAGGFGITYLVSSEIMVDNVPVITFFALKEHFLRKACERKDSKVCSTSNNASDVEKSKENFISEAKRLNKLSAAHNNIVRVNEYFSANDTAYYVMEYIDGISLRSLIKQNGGKPLQWEEAWRIMLPVAEAISYLHDNRLTHLDIKPDNIILDSKKGNRPVLIDFGLSKHYDRNGEPTSTIRVTGCSDGYSPIEQYVGLSSFSPKADVYALAATLLFLLTAQNPVIATEMKEEKIRESLEGKVPSYVLDNIVKALSRQQENRTPTVKDFIEGMYEPDAEHTTPKYDSNKTDDSVSTQSSTVKIDEPKIKPKIKLSRYKWILIGSLVIIVALVAYAFLLPDRESYEILSDGSKFYGILDEDNRPDGEGRLVAKSGKVYTGIWQNGTLESGVMKTPEYEYEGSFVDMLPSGYGMAIYNDEKTYVGNWSQGEWNGLGRLTEKSGNISFGTFKNGSLTNTPPFKVGEMVYGIDVSKWQRKIDWKNLYLPADEQGRLTNDSAKYMQPAFYAIIRATDGTEEDEYYDLNYVSAKKCGITVGAYHFLTTKKSVEDQVKFFIETAHLEHGDLPPILDLEMPHDIMKSNRKEICAMALQWCEGIEAHYGVKPLIYTYYSFIRDYLTDPRFENYQYFVAYHRQNLPPVNNWMIWQFSDKMRIPAITDNSVDTDIFNGNYADFLKFIKYNGIPNKDGENQ